MGAPSPVAEVTLTAAQAAVMVKALIDAEHYWRDSATAWCAGCAATPDGACPDHVAFLAPVSSYRELAAELAQAKIRPAVMFPHHDRPRTNPA
jgi:hypothetical protein